MKQVLASLNNGVCRVMDVPAPTVKPGFLLVANRYSVISSGTERGTVSLGKMSLIGKARARPEQAMKVLQVARSQGPLTAYNAAMRSLEMPVELGYSCAGEVLEVGRGVEGVSPGDLVACGGAGFANHAEIVCVPKNLTVKIPDGLSLEHAAFATLGAISLQSVRVADVNVGENVGVIGLGLVGLLTTQLLRASGCRVFGIDILAERVEFARKHGWCEAATLGSSNLTQQVATFSRNIGLDAVIITAASDDNEPVVLAGQLLRPKGRVVCVGRTRMEAPRETYLFKELELRTSMAYGPGTGDPEYELKGLDYPCAYVRWTENRNMSAFLDLAAGNALELGALVSHRFDVEDGAHAFELLTGGSPDAIRAIVLQYPRPSEERLARSFTIAHRRSTNSLLNIGVIGAGSFATNELVPLLAKSDGVALRTIVSATGVRARALADKYGFEIAGSEPSSVVSDPAIDCVFVLTRHDTHAELAEAALRAGKHVLVEKPLALNMEALERVVTAQQDTKGLLFVGFNRRYAPLAKKLKSCFSDRRQPMSISYRANVGYRPPSHWLHDPLQGGGVIVGEACHHIDFCNWLVGSAPEFLQCHCLSGNDTGLLSADNVHIVLGYPDGSIAAIAYLSNGSKAYNNERVEVLCEGKLGVVTDYRSIEIAQGQRVKRNSLWLGADKGHRNQIQRFVSACRSGNTEDVWLEGYIESSRNAIQAAAQIAASV